MGKTSGKDLAPFKAKSVRVAAEKSPGLVHYVLAQMGWVKPTAEEVKPMIDTALREADSNLYPRMAKFFDLRVKKLADETFAFAAKAERVDASVPYPSGYRPLTVLGQFDPTTRKFMRLRTLNRTPAPGETVERFSGSDKPQHVPCPLGLIPF
ncbi:MAG: hypothetical protein FJY99_13605 [Candidatus Sericytochromatia bacterium]|nr:hypothetical protein [Candidatus Tanganyikabacteria bacterium]